MKAENAKIRVCLKCKSFIFLPETPEGKIKLKQFEQTHKRHTLITTDYSEKDNLECGKIKCEDNDFREELHFGT